MLCVFYHLFIIKYIFLHINECFNKIKKYNMCKKPAKLNKNVKIY